MTLTGNDITVVIANPPGRVLPIMTYTGRLRAKLVPFSGFSYFERAGKSQPEVSQENIPPRVVAQTSPFKILLNFIYLSVRLPF